MRPSSWRGVLGLGTGLVLIAFWGVVAWRIARYPENHVGVSPLGVIPVGVLALVAGGLWWTAHRRRSGASLVVLGLVTVVGVVLLDRLDILVEYESWLARGMPERPF